MCIRDSYQVIPLYREELQYKLEHGSDALLDLCPDESLEVINPHRLNAVSYTHLGTGAVSYGFKGTVGSCNEDMDR